MPKTECKSYVLTYRIVSTAYKTVVASSEDEARRMAESCSKWDDIPAQEGCYLVSCKSL